VAKAKKIKRKEKMVVLMMTASAYVTKSARKVVEAAMAKAVVKMAAVEVKAVVKVAAMVKIKRVAAEEKATARVEVTDRIN